MALRNKQKAFVETYLRFWNATEAAKAAGYSEKTAYSIGQENLKKPEIEACIQKRLAEMKMSADEVLILFADQARASIKPFIKVTKEGFVYFDFSQPEALKYLHLIKKIKSKRTRRVVGHGNNSEEWEDETVEVELVDSQAALKLIGSHYKLFTDEIPSTNVSLKIDGLQAVLDQAYGEGKPSNKTTGSNQNSDY